MKDSQIFIYKETGYQDLPKDMKKYLTEYLEPKQVLETCKEIDCDWGKLLNLHYDYVTQGFAVGNTDEEKYKYLAERVSKNVDVENPEIIFIHFNGKQLGTKSFFKVYDTYDEEDIVEELIKRERAIINGLEESSAIEWIRRDDYNSWIKVLNRKDLPNEFVVSVGNGRRAILRDNIVYDYPNKRTKINMKSYPFNKKNFIKKLEEQIEHDEYYTFNENIMDYFNESTFNENMYNYSVYDIMTDWNINKTEAEVFANILNSWDIDNSMDFLEDLEKY